MRKWWEMKHPVHEKVLGEQPYLEKWEEVSTLEIKLQQTNKKPSQGRKSGAQYPGKSHGRW